MPGIGLKIDPAGENNLVGNASFETDTSGWSLSAPSWASSSLTNPTTSFTGSLGSKAARMQATKDATATLRTAFLTYTSPASSVIPGAAYNLSVPVKVVDAPAGGVAVYVSWLDASGALISSSTTSAVYKEVGTTLLEAKSLVAPAGSDQARVVVQFSSEVSGDTVDVYVDVVQLATAELDLNDGTKFRAMEAKYPTPQRVVNWAESTDTEGALPASLRYQNRQISVICRVYGSSASDLQTQLGYLEQKIGKINEEEGVGGTHEYVSPSGTACIFDLLEGSADYDLDNTALASRRVVVTITFTALPFWRAGKANEIAGPDHVETTLPCAVGLDTAIGGDVPALGRLVIDEDQGQDQWTLIWGAQSRWYDASVDAALFYQAETREPLGGAATAAATGASGSGNNSVAQTSLLTSYQAMLSTQATGGGNHMRQIGVYRVFGRFLRPSANTGAVGVCLEWGEGDFRRRTRNDAVEWAANETEEVWRIADLGLVRLSKAAAGAQRWEGRILAKSSVAGDDLYCDWLMLVPVSEGYGTSKNVLQVEPDGPFLGQDDFDQSAGALAGKVAGSGGTWAGAGDADDFSIVSSTAQRTAVSDVAGTPRYAILGTGTALDVSLRLNVTTNNAPYDEGWKGGALVRYVDASNWLALLVTRETAEIWPGVNANKYSTQLWKKVAGVKTLIPGSSVQLGTFQTGLSVSFGLWLIALSNGEWRAGALQGGPPATTQRVGSDTALGAGGALKEGKFGLFDEKTSAGAETRSFDKLEVWAPPRDAVVFASQSCEVRSDRALREDASGTVWVSSTGYRGSYFRPPPARREGRILRTIVKLSRGNVDTMADTGIDDLSFRIFWQSRGLVLPES
jgi:hypothetical protein